MKTDTLSFSFVAAIVLAGVIVALTSPAHPLAPAAAPVAVYAAPHAPVDAAIDELSAEHDLSVSE